MELKGFSMGGLHGAKKRELSVEVAEVGHGQVISSGLIRKSPGVLACGSPVKDLLSFSYEAKHGEL